MALEVLLMVSLLTPCNTGEEWLNELIKTLFSRLAFSRSEVATIFPCSRAGSVLVLDFTDLTGFQNSLGLLNLLTLHLLAQYRNYWNVSWTVAVMAVQLKYA